MFFETPRSSKPSADETFCIPEIAEERNVVLEPPHYFETICSSRESTFRSYQLDFFLDPMHVRTLCSSNLSMLWILGRFRTIDVLKLSAILKRSF